MDITTEQPADAPRSQGNLEEQRRHVFARYIEQMFRRRRSDVRYTERQTVRWLMWLAQQMIGHKYTVFYLEWIQPDWLPTRVQQRLVKLSVVVASVLSVEFVFGLTVLIGWLAYRERSLLYDALVLGGIGLCVGLAVAWVGIRRGQIEVLHWSWSKMRWGLLRGLVRGFLIVLVFDLLLVLSLVFVHGEGELLLEEADIYLEAWFTWEIIGTLMGGLMGALLGGQVGGEVNSREVPNEGIYRASRSMLVGGIFGALALAPAGLVLGLYGRISGNSYDKLFGGLVLGMLGWIVGMLIKGGYTCLQHLVLRILLTYKKVTPWRYIDFLDYAADRILLRKVGGGYMFIHRYLLEYFASLDTGTHNSEPLDET